MQIPRSATGFGSRTPSRSLAPNLLPARRPCPCPRTAREEASTRDVVEEREQLLNDLKACVKREDYAAATLLKNQVEELESRTPYFRLQKQLAQAVKDQRFKDAAALQQQLQKLQAEEGSSLPLDTSSVSTSSDVTTAPGIRVQVQSYFMPSNSAPSQGHYLFGYHVTITNNSSAVVQLKNRHWMITDPNRDKQEPEHVRGPGVVGQQPVLLPGKSFAYDSGCPLRGPTGTMEGEFSFVVLDETDGRFKDMVEAKVGRFKLSAEGAGSL